MIARRIPSILPELSREEALDVTRIYSVAGLLPAGAECTERPHATKALAGERNLLLAGEGCTGRLFQIGKRGG